jgi:hypothetical protein
VIRTTAERPFSRFSTTTIVSNGSDRCAAVNFLRLCLLRLPSPRSGLNRPMQACTRPALHRLRGSAPAKPVAATQSQSNVIVRRLLASRTRSSESIFVATWQARRQIKRAAQYPGEFLGDLMPQEGEKDDDRNGNSQQVKQNSTAHDFLLCSGLAYPSVRLALKSRTFPPRVAARLAAKAPKSRAAVSHRDNLAAAFRALSKSVFAWSMTFETRLSASA